MKAESISNFKAEQFPAIKSESQIYLFEYSKKKTRAEKLAKDLEGNGFEFVLTDPDDIEELSQLDLNLYQKRTYTDSIPDEIGSRWGEISDFDFTDAFNPTFSEQAYKRHLVT